MICRATILSLLLNHFPGSEEAKAFLTALGTFSSTRSVSSLECPSCHSATECPSRW